MSAVSSSVPDPGQIVQVRQRPFVVQGVLDNPLPARGLEGNGHLRQHLVSLSSVEEDAFGEELEVIWELEPSARVEEQNPLPVPDGFDAPERLDAFLDALQAPASRSSIHPGISSRMSKRSMPIRARRRHCASGYVLGSRPRWGNGTIPHGNRI